ncbi:MAG: hypothetical protein WB770_10975 [Acidimicrobiales bacterium]
MSILSRLFKRRAKSEDGEPSPLKKEWGVSGPNVPPHDYKPIIEAPRTPKPPDDDDEELGGEG